jgi:hypothetical protein
VTLRKLSSVIVEFRLTRQSTQTVAINPYLANQFIILFKSGDYGAMLPNAYSDTIGDAFNASLQHTKVLNEQAMKAMPENTKTAMDFISHLSFF